MAQYLLYEMGTVFPVFDIYNEETVSCTSQEISNYLSPHTVLPQTS